MVAQSFYLSRMKIGTIFGAILLLILVLFLSRESFGRAGGIQDIWYINMDKSTERRQNIENQLRSLAGSIPYTRWPGVNGHALTDEDFNRLEIPAWSRPIFTVEKRQKIRKGEIGCYLSHLTLLQHLQARKVSAKAGHLILEDDIKMDPEFFRKAEQALKKIPSDWDILTFGLPEGSQTTKYVVNVRENIGRTVWMNNDFAYVVKHSSLQKIIREVSIIREPFDTCLGRASKVGALNIYSYVPPLVSPRDQNDTTMNGV